MQCTEIKGVDTSLIMVKVKLPYICHEGIKGSRSITPLSLILGAEWTRLE